MAHALVEVVTAAHAIVGKCAVIAGSVRLVEVLNQEARLLTLIDCELRALSGGEPTRAPTCFVPKDRIIWARPLDAPDDDEDGQHPEALDRIAKKPFPVLALAPPFRITANAHIAEAADPSLVTDRLFNVFFPLTDANIVFDGPERAEWQAPVIVLNGPMADAIAADSLSQQTATPDAALAS